MGGTSPTLTGGSAACGGAFSSLAAAAAAAMRWLLGMRRQTPSTHSMVLGWLVVVTCGDVVVGREASGVMLGMLQQGALSDEEGGGWRRPGAFDRFGQSVLVNRSID